MSKNLDIRSVEEAKVETKILCNEEPSVPWEVSVDTCIVGAGIGGISAAVEASRLGQNVVIVDSLPTLGGQAVNGIVGTFCGLFSNGPDPNKHYQFTHGIADDILHELDAIDALSYRRGKWTTVLYDEVALGRWVEGTVLENGIKPILGAVMRKVHKAARRISSIELATRYGDIHIEADYFIDATGDAALTYQAGLPCREPAEGAVYGSQMVVVEGIFTEHIPDRTEIAVRLQEVGEDYGLVRREGFAFSFPGRDTALVNMTHVETPLNPIALAQKSLEGKMQADKAIRFLKTEFPDAFSGVSVRSYGQLGVRQTRWIVGAKQLTVEQVLAGTYFDDAIARTAWAIELHDKEDSHIFHSFDEGHVHYVPFGSMTPPEIDNIIAVGRCIDGDVAALSSVRVMGPCIAMGAAAANAIDLAKPSGSVHDIDIYKLQYRVRDNLEKTV